MPKRPSETPMMVQMASFRMVLLHPKTCIRFLGKISQKHKQQPQSALTIFDFFSFLKVELRLCVPLAHVSNEACSSNK